MAPSNMGKIDRRRRHLVSIPPDGESVIRRKFRHGNGRLNTTIEKEKKNYSCKLHTRRSYQTTISQGTSHLILRWDLKLIHSSFPHPLSNSSWNNGSISRNSASIISSRPIHVSITSLHTSPLAHPSIIVILLITHGSHHARLH